MIKWLIGIDPVSAALSLADDVIVMGEKLSPDIHDLIQASMPAFRQWKFSQRMRRCKRHCRRGKFGADQIASQVRIDFQDQPEKMQTDIIMLITYMLVGDKK